jgi:hypothetical protein
MSPKQSKSSRSTKFPPAAGVPQTSMRPPASNYAEQIAVDATSALETNQRMLAEIQEKMLHSPALNGGFDTLLKTVNKIEDSQSQIVNKLTLIHDAIYHPDDGLFARVKMVEMAKSEGLDKLEKEIFEIRVWKTNEEKIKEKQVKEDELFFKQDEEREELLMQHDSQLKEVLDFKNKISSAFKWVAVSISTGGLGVLGKLIYDFFVGHVKFL